MNNRTRHRILSLVATEQRAGEWTERLRALPPAHTGPSVAMQLLSEMEEVHAPEKEQPDTLEREGYRSDFSSVTLLITILIVCVLWYWYIRKKG